MNTIELASIYQKELDKKMVASATSGWMELNDKLVKYEGGDEIKIADITMDGLGDYDRTSGFPSGDLNLKFSTYKMTMDRGRSFTLDSMDVDESNFIATSGAVIKEFQDTKVVPEIDSYRYSTISQKAMENKKASYGYTPAEATIFQKLTDDIARVQDIIGDGVPLVVSLPVIISNILFNNDKISKSIGVADFSKGEITTRVKTINDTPIIPVPSGRMKTKYIFYSGKGEQAAGGFTAAEDALSINWIISAAKAPVAVSKQDIVRIFEPGQNINADAWKIDYRRYHDLWLPKNKIDSVWVNIREAEPSKPQSQEG